MHFKPFLFLFWALAAISGSFSVAIPKKGHVKAVPKVSSGSTTKFLQHPQALLPKGITCVAKKNPSAIHLHKRNNEDLSVWTFPSFDVEHHAPEMRLGAGNRPFVALRGQRIGSGMCGEVYAINNLPDVVAKIYQNGNEGSRRIAYNEVRMLAAVRQLVGVNSFHLKDSHVNPVLYMKRAPGVPLRETNWYRSSVGHPLFHSQMHNVRQAVEHAINFYLLRYGILHGDIKDENILWTEHRNEHNGQWELSNSPTLIDWQSGIDMRGMERDPNLQQHIHQMVAAHFQ